MNKKTTIPTEEELISPSAFIHPQIDKYKNESLTLESCDNGWETVVYFCINNAVSFIDYTSENSRLFDVIGRYNYPESSQSGYSICFYTHKITNKIYVRWDWYDSSSNMSCPPSAHAYYEISKDVYASFIDDLKALCQASCEKYINHLGS